jgi:hypothetical protein
MKVNETNIYSRKLPPLKSTSPANSSKYMSNTEGNDRLRHRRRYNTPRIITPKLKRVNTESPDPTPVSDTSLGITFQKLSLRQKLKDRPLKNAKTTVS